MTFAAKFEILENLTRGTVETFVARKLPIEECVLVHVFEAGEQPPNQPTVQWILESFRAVAPDPCGPVVETGRYDATSYGYLVTKLPEKSVLEAWLQSYEAQQKTEAGIGGVKPTDKRATTRSSTESNAEVAAPRSELQPRLNADLPPSTAHPEDANRLAISAEFPGTGVESSRDVQPQMPGDFTRQFSPGLIGEHPNTGRRYSDPRPRGEQAEPSPLTPSEEASGRDKRIPASSATETTSVILRRVVPSTDSRESHALADNSLPTGSPPSKPIRNATPGKTDSSAMGEFTRFFHGPFHGERSAKASDFPPPTASEAKQTGDFTKLFGPAKADSSAGVKANLSAAPPSESGSFTQFFEGTGARKRISSAYNPELGATNNFESKSAGSPGEKGPSVSEPVSWPGKVSGDVPAPPPFQNKAAASGADLRFSFRSESDGATRVFSPEERGFAFGSSTPAGPSEYTKIVAGGVRRSSALGESFPTAGRPESSGSANAAPPTIPPAIPSPLVPQFPFGGGQAQVPAPPVVPTSAPKATGTPWAMILILNGLFVLAVLLVLYFIFRR